MSLEGLGFKMRPVTAAAESAYHPSTYLHSVAAAAGGGAPYPV